MPCKSFAKAFRSYLRWRRQADEATFFAHLTRCADCARAWAKESAFEGKLRSACNKKKQTHDAAGAFPALEFQLNLMGALRSEKAKLADGQGACSRPTASRSSAEAGAPASRGIKAARAESCRRVETLLLDRLRDALRFNLALAPVLAIAFLVGMRSAALIEDAQAVALDPSEPDNAEIIASLIAERHSGIQEQIPAADAESNSVYGGLELDGSMDGGFDRACRGAGGTPTSASVGAADCRVILSSY